MSRTPRGRGGIGVNEDQGPGILVYLAFVIFVLTSPIWVASLVTWAISFGQEKLKPVDMAKLENQLVDYPQLYSMIESFRNWEVTTVDYISVWILTFLLTGLVAWVSYFVIALYIAHRDYRRREKSLVSRPNSSDTRHGYVETGGGRSGGYEGSSGSGRSKAQPEPNPLFQASEIERGTGERILKQADRDVGYLRTDSVSRDKQLMYDASGRHIDSIEADSVHPGSQLIKDPGGQKIAEIKTDWRGDRVLVDKDGREIGKFKDGRIERSSSYRGFLRETDYEDSSSGSSQSSYHGECPYCGGPIDESGYCLEECEDEDA